MTERPAMEDPAAQPHLLTPGARVSPPRPRAARHERDNRHRHRRGVVGVIVQANELLVIRRSLLVRAPGKFCFPGGGVEIGESEEEALVREMSEELSVTTRPVERLWENSTRSGVRLGWWLTEITPLMPPVANPEEVAEIRWLAVQQILALEGLLETNREFFTAWHAGHFRLPISTQYSSR